MNPVFAILRAVPIWAYVVAAVLAWGGFQKHRATVAAGVVAAQAQKAAQERETALAAAIQERDRRLSAQAEVVNHANVELDRVKADAGRTLSERDRLRARLASLQARKPDPGASAPAASPADSLPDLLGQCADRYASVAAEADRAIVAGLACQQSYESLTQPVAQ